MIKLKNRHNFAPTPQYHSTFNTSNGRITINPYAMQNPFKVPAKFYSLPKQQENSQSNPKALEQCRYHRKYQNSYLTRKQNPLAKTHKILQQKSVHQKVWNNYVGQMEFLKSKIQNGGMSQFEKAMRMRSIGTFSSNSKKQNKQNKNKVVENPFYRKNLISALKQSNISNQFQNYSQYQSIGAVSSYSQYQNYDYAQFQDISQAILPYSLKKITSNQRNSKKSSPLQSPRDGEYSPYQLIYDGIRQIQINRSRKPSLNDSFGPKKGQEKRKQFQQILTQIAFNKINSFEDNSEDKQIIIVKGKKFYKNKVYQK